MPHQDQGRPAAAPPGAIVKHALAEDFVPEIVAALRWLITSGCFGRLAFRTDCWWTPVSLVQTALLWAWSEEAALTERFATARQTIAEFTRPQRESVSYQAFVKVLSRYSGQLLFALVERMQSQMQRSLAGAYRVSGYLLFGVDGTRIEVPRTRAHELAGKSSRPRRGRRKHRRLADEKKATAPGLWLTTLWHVGTGLPWGWLSGPAHSDERGHLLRMLAWLPAGSLLAADAGFVGYDCWKTLEQAGHHFLIRVGANVTLLRRLGYYRETAGRVYLWPERAVRQRQPPLVLRLVIVHDGRHPVHLVTNILSQAALTDRQVIEMYHARWGIEVFYRSFKQTFGRRKLRCTSPGNAQLELDWSLAALWAACLYAKHQQQQAGVDIRRTSVAGVLRILRRAIRWPWIELQHSLATALIDDYPRSHKASREYPRQKTDYLPAAPPQLLLPTPQQRNIAQQLRRLTA